MNINPNQIVPAAQTGVELLNQRTTLIPGDMKSQVVVLESILMGIATGGLVVVPNPENVVKSDLDNGKKEDGNGDDSGDTGGERETES